MNQIVARAVLLFFLFPTSLLVAQRNQEKYWVMFTDKGDISRYHPLDILAQRSLDRRANQGLTLQFSDYPVDKAYITGVVQAGADCRHASKWLNAVSVWMDLETKARVDALPFVRQIKPIPKVTLEMDAPEPLLPMRDGYNAGFSRYQLQQVGLDRLHQNGYNGRGVLISVMDNGFKNADKNPHLRHLFDGNRIVATRDFVNNEADVFNEGDHGQWVLSILAAWSETSENSEFWYYGSAHGASYILCHTEDNTAETHQEEDNWAAAMEYADSIGADVFSTSLGYRDFDNGDDYGYVGMDGNTTIITIAADLAASKGIVVVNSAGNSGANKMLAPSDGDSVISVGAVDSMGVIAGFSSQGPSYDGRVKPDISAMGKATGYMQSTGTLSRGNGTSFSCPVASGLCACLIQSKPGVGNMVLYDALIRSASQYANPDSLYGYGIPNGAAAYQLLHGRALPGILPSGLVKTNSAAVYPNPVGDWFHIVIDNEWEAQKITIDIIDMVGRKVLSRNLDLAPFYNVFRLERNSDYPNVVSGQYVVSLQYGSGRPVSKTKITIINER